MFFGVISLFNRKKRKQSKVIEKEVKISSIVPTEIEYFNEYHYKVLRKLHKHRVGEEIGGLLGNVVDIESFIPVLLKLNLIDYVPYKSALCNLNVDELKQILRRFNLKVSGRKVELVKRIIENIGEEVTKEPEYSSYYQLTELGYKVLNESLEKIQKEKLAFFSKMLNLIMNDGIEEAYKGICKQNDSSPINVGMGCDWKNWERRGIPRKEKELYEKYLKTSEDMFATAGAIFSIISGNDIGQVTEYINLLFERTIDAEEIRYISSCINSERELSELAEDNIEKYSFLATLDSETCPICGKLDGKNFKVDDAAIGVNCPPMHKGCRCTIISYADVISLKSMKRRARNPETGRSELIPYMNYSKWKKTYLTNKIKEQ